LFIEDAGQRASNALQ